jgi:hypothetical protein
VRRRIPCPAGAPRLAALMAENRWPCGKNKPTPTRGVNCVGVGSSPLPSHCFARYFYRPIRQTAYSLSRSTAPTTIYGGKPGRPSRPRHRVKTPERWTWRHLAGNDFQGIKAGPRTSEPACRLVATVQPSNQNSLRARL